jgi:hypothetical protein
MSYLDRISVKLQNDVQPIEYNIKEEYSVHKFKINYLNFYFAMLEHKLLLKPIDFKIGIPTFEFFEKNTKISSVIIKINEKIQNDKVKRVISNTDEAPPLKTTLVDKLIEDILVRLIELWNLSTTFDELEFLLFHLNNMPPLLEVSSKSGLEMVRKIKYIPTHYGGALTGIEKIDIDETWKSFDSKDLEKLKSLIHRHLLEDNEWEFGKRISLIIELLGYATLSDKYKDPKEDFGLIAINLNSIKSFHKKFQKKPQFKGFSKIIEECFSYNIAPRDFKENFLLAKVFYHEFGHLYFGHCNSISPRDDNPNITRESYANFFASVLFNNQKRSLLIWLMTRFQINAYKSPKLLKMSEDYNKINFTNSHSINCLINMKSLIDLIKEERDIRTRNGGFHR